MTLKEKVAEIMPEMVGEDFAGGVKVCPMNYDFLKGHYEAKEIEGHCFNQYKCEKCWNMEYIEDYVPDINVGNKNIRVGTKWRDKKTEEVITIICLGENNVWFVDDENRTGSIARENFTKNYEYIKDNINHPEHYQGKHECIDIMRVLFGDEAVKGFCKCNAFKYRFRAGKKEENTAEQDIKKAEWYEEYLFRMEEK